MTASTGTPAQEPEAPSKLSQQLIAWARTALPAVVSAIGVSGFVSILGAAVLWARFNAAGLPAGEAVGDQSTTSLIVTGAVSLCLYFVLGLLAVLVVYLLQGVVLSQILSRPSSAPGPSSVTGRSSASRPSSADPVGRLKQEARLVKSRIAEIEHDLTEAKKAEDGQLKDLNGQLQALKRLRKKAHGASHKGGHGEEEAHGKAAAPPQLDAPVQAAVQVVADSRKALEAQQARVKVLQRETRETVLRADAIARELFAARSSALGTRHYGNASALLILVSLELALVVTRTAASWGEKALLWAGLLAVALGAITAAFSATRVTDLLERRGRGPVVLVGALAAVAIILIAALVDPWTLTPVAASLLLALMCFAIGRLHPRRFFWLGISVFASVALFGAVLTYARNVNAPSAQAAAVLLKNGCTVQGLWIGESADRVFLARVAPGQTPAEGHPKEGRIFSLDRSHVISESIGKLRRVSYAGKQSTTLRSELLAIQGESVLTAAICTATGQTSDYFAGAMSSFEGPATLHSGPLAEPLCLVRYFDRRRAKSRGGDPGAPWWTTCKYDESMLTSVALVRKKLALPKAWGARDARVTATIPAGASITYLSGTAAKQCEQETLCYEGGGVQLLFHDRDVNRKWFGPTECDSAPESATTWRFERCRP